MTKPARSCRPILSTVILQIDDDNLLFGTGRLKRHVTVTIEAQIEEAFVAGNC